MKRVVIALIGAAFATSGFAQTISPPAAAAVNLTGPITSVGAATSIASQTGTGTKFVVDTGPTLVGPVVVSAGSFGLSGDISAAAWTTSGIRYKNVAATLTDTSSSGTVAAAYTNVFGANTIAASSATTYTNYYNSYFTDPVAGTNVTLTKKWAMGADSLFITGNTASSGNTSGALVVTGGVGLGADLRMSSGGGIQIDNALNINCCGNGTALGLTSAKAFGISNATNTFTTIDTRFSRASAGVWSFDTTTNGNGLGGFTAATAVLTGLGTDSGQTDNTLCLRTDTKAVVTGTGTLGICLGTSSIRYKTAVIPMRDGLAQVLALRPVNFFYKPGYGDGGAHPQYGLIAEDVATILPKLTGRDAEGKPSSVDLLGMVPVLIKAVQDQQAQILTLRSQLAALQKRK